jgi:DNA anti-recombination protein RmuC
MGKMMGSIREKKEEMTQKFSQEFDLLIQKIWREIEQGVQALNQKNTYKLVEIKQQLITDFTYIIAAVP